MTALIDRLRPLYIDHIAVTTTDLQATVRDYLALPGARISRGPGDNPAQKVRYCFVQLEGGLRIEVLGLPATGDSPIEGHLARGGGAYHICYAVADLEGAIARASDHSARLVAPPRPDPAHDGRRVAFLIAPSQGLFELVEAYPDFAAPLPDNSDTPAASGHAASTADVKPGSDADLIAAFRHVFRTLDDTEIRQASFGRTKGWDSLGHLQLVMEVERRLGVRVPMTRIGELDSFAAFETLIAQLGA